MPSFSPPTNPVGTFNPCYMTNASPGTGGTVTATTWNTSILGSPTQTGANVLSNCVGQAQGRMLEVYMETHPGFTPVTNLTHPFVTLNLDPVNWEAAARAAGLEIVYEPQAGSVLVTNSHVAFVESFDTAAGLWYVSESGYGNTVPWHYWTGTLIKNPVTGDWESTFSYAGQTPDPHINCFILVPDAEPGPGPGPGPGPTPDRKSKWIYYLKNWNNEIY